MAKLTKRIVDALEAKDARPAYAWDDQLRGFGVKALPSGHKRYVVKYRSGTGGRKAAQRWLTLGSHGAITCDQARDMARQALAAVANGEDPQADKLARRHAPTINDLWERFEQEQLPLKKPSTAKDYRQRWRDIIRPAFGSQRITDLTRADIDRAHKRLRATPYQANRLLSQLSRMLNLAEGWGWREAGTNPCSHVEKFKEEGRTRYLSAVEIERLGSAIDGLTQDGELLPQAAAAIRLLLLTGARLNEVLTARWDWVDFDRRTIDLPDSKTGKKPVFLSEPALAVLDDLKLAGTAGSPFIIPGRSGLKPLNNLSKSWRKVCARAGLNGVRLHDLRHTAASIAVGRGASLSLIGRLLGHSQPQTTQRYAHVDNDPALAVADEVGHAVGGALRIGARRARVAAMDDSWQKR